MEEAHRSFSIPLCGILKFDDEWREVMRSALWRMERRGVAVGYIGVNEDLGAAARDRAVCLLGIRHAVRESEREKGRKREREKAAHTLKRYLHRFGGYPIYPSSSQGYTKVPTSSARSNFS